MLQAIRSINEEEDINLGKELILGVVLMVVMLLTFFLWILPLIGSQTG